MRCSGRSTLGQAELACLLLVTLLTASCTPGSLAVPPPRAAFPPQAVIEHGDYARFLAENRQVLEHCQAGEACAVALFNLGFVYAYPHSPYHDPTKAQQFVAELLKSYGETPWASQGLVWLALINQRLVLEETQRRLQGDLRDRETTIRSLQGRLKRLRDIDLQMDQKERELSR